MGERYVSKLLQQSTNTQIEVKSSVSGSCRVLEGFLEAGTFEVDLKGWVGDGWAERKNVAS
jgi:hypothetical protein